LALNNPLLEVLLITGMAVFALTSALAAACFAKAFGTIFLARPRSEVAQNANEVPFAMLVAPGILAALCVGLGVFSYQIVSTVRPGLPIPDMLPISIMLFILAAIAVLLLRVIKAPVRKTETWGCGIPHQTGRMEYTAAGFSEPIVTVFKAIFRTRKIAHREYSDKFQAIPSRSSGEITTLKFFEERIYFPMARFFMRVGGYISDLHNADMDALILYAFIAIVVVILGVGWWL
jgi:NADH:ubiquinone oxidoreductase subunit 5 (subunit L)/multisubunit Na+/H+ antiporter MnhA subunit